MSLRPPLGVKICGVTRLADARLAVELGARFIGLNFHPPSPRCLDLASAARLAESVRGRVEVVGVFVNRPADEVRATAAAVGLDWVQLHGDESEDYVAGLGAADLGAHTLRAVRTGGSLAGFDAARYSAAQALLFDVAHAELFGGTGQEWGYGELAGLALDRPYFVAGGIHPGNARRALAASGAHGLDVCSGVESAPGVKDPLLLERLMKEVLDAA